MINRTFLKQIKFISELFGNYLFEEPNNYKGLWLCKKMIALTSYQTILTI